MDEIEIIHIPCDFMGEKQTRLIELLIEIAKTLNIELESGKDTENQEAA